MDAPFRAEGDRQAIEAFLPRIAGRFYVYLLCRPDGRPFYVGKGIKRRVLQHEAEARQNHLIRESNPFKCNVIRNIIREGGQVRYRIDSVFAPDDQQACLEREAALIRQHGRLHEGGCLTNLAGGLGALAGTSSPFSRARHAATLSGEPAGNPDRATLNRFLRGIGPVDSVPIKPVSQIARVCHTTPHPSPRRPTLRSAYALIASACATGQVLVDGVELPRRFIYDGVHAIVENGVARDILKAGMADLVPAPDPGSERFTLQRVHLHRLIGLVGEEMLAARGLL